MESKIPGFVASKRKVETELHEMDAQQGSTPKKKKVESNATQAYSAVAQRIMVITVFNDTIYYTANA